MPVALFAAIVAAGTSIVVAVVGHAFTKRRERELEWRKLKLEHYQEYVAALSGIAGRRSNPEAQARYADAFNAMMLIAPSTVLKALYEFQEETRINNPNRTFERYESLHDALISLMRRDIHPELADPRIKFIQIDAPAAPQLPRVSEDQA